MSRSIAILGAGPAALTAAWNLSEPGSTDEITIYQQGWRAGGLCSSGRVGKQQWINQNGTHYLFGCYSASLGLLEAAYEVLRENGDTRFGSFETQLVPRDLIVIRQMFQSAWTDWVITMPRRGGKLGATTAPAPHQAWTQLTRGTFDLLKTPEMKEAIAQTDRSHDDILAGLRRFVEALEERVEGVALDALSGLISAAESAFERLLVDLDKAGLDGPIDALAKLLAALRDAILAVLEPLGELSVTARRLAILADLGLTVAVGGLIDRAFSPEGLAALDALDFRAWLTKHGARKSSVWSPPVAVWYDSIAAYEGGSQKRPEASTCATLIGVARLMVYPQAFAYQLAWEAGDSVIAPIVAALGYRGVRFVYFHRVWDIVPSADGRRIERVELEKQLELTHGDPTGYQPFLKSAAVPGRLVWPDEPLWAQIKTPKPEDWVGGLAAELLHELPIDPAKAPRATAGLESSFYPRLGLTVVLQAGTDFDMLIGAMGLPMYTLSAPSLLAASSAMRDAVRELGAGETQSLRFWLEPTLEGLGWTTQAPILSAYAEPFATWEDPSECLASEDWPSPRPQTVSHLFGALESKPLGEQGADYVQTQTRAAYLNAAAWSAYTVGTLWPGAALPSAPLALDPGKATAIQVRANVGLEQLYTQILPKTAAFRPAPGLTSYENFALCGDWTKTELMTGSVEGAVESGISVARALAKR